MAAWALSVGTAVGWGSLVVTSNTYLNSSGPLGTILGLVAGAVLMLLMCRNFFFMASHYPRAGGIYTSRRRSTAMTAPSWCSGSSV
jgi:amino acid permease